MLDRITHSRSPFSPQPLLWTGRPILPHTGSPLSSSVGSTFAPLSARFLSAEAPSPSPPVFSAPRPVGFHFSASPCLDHILSFEPSPPSPPCPARLVHQSRVPQSKHLASMRRPHPFVQLAPVVPSLPLQTTLAFAVTPVVPSLRLSNASGMWRAFRTALDSLVPLPPDTEI